MMFASTAAIIHSGAMAERTNCSSYLLEAIGITTVMYPVLGSWTWNENGLLKHIGFIDFAGSTVVHSAGERCSLAGIIILGPYQGRFGANGKAHVIPGHNLGMISIGGFLLWFGWFGFNAGSTLASSTNIGDNVVNTELAGAVGAMLMSLTTKQLALMGNAINGSIGGLVAITASCATMDIPFAILTGMIGGGISILVLCC